ncbi:MAG TPA: ABC transporter substrate-binding protein, partial [Mucilaginibacter sp.]
MKFLRFLLTGWLLLTSALLAYSQNIKWLEVEPGIWKGIVGKPESFDLLKASGAVAAHQGLSDMGQAKFPMAEANITAKVTDGKTYLHFPLSKNEQLYGFGLNFQTVQQRGKILTLHVDNYEGKDNGRTHSPTPFYISSNGYGVFINSARYLQVYAGTAVRTDSKNPPVAQDR